MLTFSWLFHNKYVQLTTGVFKSQNSHMVVKAKMDSDCSHIIKLSQLFRFILHVGCKYAFEILLSFVWVQTNHCTYML